MRYWLVIVFVLGIMILFAQNGIHPEIVERMPTLVIQVGIIIIAARIGSTVFEKLHFPGVLGELLVGIIIGPYLLGAYPLPGYPRGLFGSHDLAFPLQPELYGLAIIASIILLFLTGLETDIDMFIRYSFTGLVVGIGGIVVSFFMGAFISVFLLHVPFSDPKSLFMGIISTATSVGITARILSEQKKMDSPEGVTIVAAAVIDDVLGIIMLAVVVGISFMLKTGKNLHWSNIWLVTAKELGLWLGFTIVGLICARRFGRFLKRFQNHIVFSILAFSIALLVSGLFEKVGLAMIIGAYIVGLSLSKTDISFTIQEALRPLKVFFVPIFFTVMGMLVNVKALFTINTFILGSVFTIGAIFSKLIGCGLPALALNFNWTGAKRIGIGMVPRGEVALIIASIGLSYGFLKDPNYNIFSIAIMMTLVTTVISPLLLNILLNNGKKGTKSDFGIPERETIELRLEDKDLTDLFVHKVIGQFQSAGFFVSQLDSNSLTYNMRRNDINIVLSHYDNSIVIQTDSTNIRFVSRLLTDSALSLKQSILGILSFDDIQLPTLQNSQEEALIDELEHLLPPEMIIPRLHKETRDGIILELIQLALGKDNAHHIDTVFQQVLDRDKNLSTGLVNGVAIPHTHTDQIEKPIVAIGISKNPVNFNSIDLKPSHLIILILTPTEATSQHIRILSLFSRLCRQPEKIKEIIHLHDRQSIRDNIIKSIASYQKNNTVK